MDMVGMDMQLHILATFGQIMGDRLRLARVAELFVEGFEEKGRLQVGTLQNIANQRYAELVLAVLPHHAEPWGYWF